MKIKNFLALLVAGLLLLLVILLINIFYIRNENNKYVEMLQTLDTIDYRLISRN